jgi:hypothetical protein
MQAVPVRRLHGPRAYALPAELAETAACRRVGRGRLQVRGVQGALSAAHPGVLQLQLGHDLLLDDVWLLHGVHGHRSGADYTGRSLLPVGPERRGECNIKVLVKHVVSLSFVVVMLIFAFQRKRRIQRYIRFSKSPTLWMTIKALGCTAYDVPITHLTWSGAFPLLDASIRQVVLKTPCCLIWVALRVYLPLDEGCNPIAALAWRSRRLRWSQLVDARDPVGSAFCTGVRRIVTQCGVVTQPQHLLFVSVHDTATSPNLRKGYLGCVY